MCLCQQLYYLPDSLFNFLFICFVCKDGREMNFSKSNKYLWGNKSCALLKSIWDSFWKEIHSPMSLHLTQVQFFFFIWSEFCHTLKWNSHGFTCVPHPDPPSHLPLHLLPLGFPSAPGPSACLMHPTNTGSILLFNLLLWTVERMTKSWTFYRNPRKERNKLKFVELKYIFLLYIWIYVLAYAGPWRESTKPAVSPSSSS